MDLTKTIKINSKYEISYGTILITFLVTLFECLAIIGFNNWQFTPAVFVLIANAIGLLKKRSEYDMNLDEFEERLKKLEEEAKERENE